MDKNKVTVVEARIKFYLFLLQVASESEDDEYDEEDDEDINEKTKKISKQRKEEKQLVTMKMVNRWGEQMKVYKLSYDQKTVIFLRKGNKISLFTNMDQITYCSHRQMHFFSQLVSLLLLK